MVSWDITIGGVSIQNIFDVEFDKSDSDSLGECTIVCANSTNNRSVKSGDAATIKKNGNVRFSGYVIGYPSKAGESKAELEIELTDKRAELKEETVNRVFYNFDTGKIVKRMVNKRAEFLSEKVVTTADDLGDWQSSADVFELGKISSKTLYNKGDDFVFAGWRKDTTGKQTITFSGIPNSAIPDEKNIDTLKVRMISNLPSEQTDIEVELYSQWGIRYRWEPEITGGGRDFTTLELKVEDAVPTGDLSNKDKIRFRFSINGKISEPRAVGIDYISTIPFYEVDRDTDLNPSGVQTTNREITRRFDKPAFDVLQTLETEDGFISYATDSNELFYEPNGNQNSPKQITYSSTPVIGAEFNRDFRDIKNEVTVQGSDDIQVKERDEASIEFYGLAPRSESIVDRNIQTREEATERGRGFLSKNAWNDVAMEFEIADTSYSEVSIGDEVSISWPPESVNGDFVVSTKNIDKNGIVRLGVTSINAT